MNRVHNGARHKICIHKYLVELRFVVSVKKIKQWNLKWPWAIAMCNGRKETLTLKNVLPSARIIDITANTGMQPSEAAAKPQPIPCAHAG